MNIFGNFAAWRHGRVSPRQQAEWDTVAGSLPLLNGMPAGDLQRLQELAVRFLRAKTLEPVGDLVLSDHDCMSLALQASLPILELGLGWYRGWSAVLIYPAEFVPTIEEVDAYGVVHTHPEARSGEAWSQGGVIVSLQDIRSAGRCNGYNVIIHEMAHKLDMLNGDANGFPPLHRKMRPAEWSAVFERAYADLSRAVDSGVDTAIDPYAADSPGECFSVFSEYFFECPHLLQSHYPAVYEQMSLFYRQDPVRRLNH